MPARAQRFEIVPNCCSVREFSLIRPLTGAWRSSLRPNSTDRSAAYWGEPAVLDLLKQYPAPNDNTVGDGLNTAGYRFNSSVPLKYDTYIARVDYQLDSNGKQTLFWRGNLQNDHYVPSSLTSSGVPQFPGQADSTVTLQNAKGIAVWAYLDHRAQLGQYHRYGFTRQSYDNTGVQSAPIVGFTSIDNLIPSTTPLSATIPVHDIEESLTWTHGAHTVVAGGSLRFIRTRRLSFANSYSGATMTPGWFVDNARYLLLPDVNPNTLSDYTQQMVNLLGLVSQGTAAYNYDKQGNLLPQGSGIKRDFADNEYEMFLQDTWKVSRGFTVTAGARVNIDPPIYEVNGYQTSTNIPLGVWQNDRAGLAEQGLPQSMVTPLSFNFPTARVVIRCIPPSATLRHGWLSLIPRRPIPAGSIACSAALARLPSGQDSVCTTMRLAKA